MFRRVVNVIEVLAVVAVAVFVIMLFANEPSGGSRAGGGGGATPGARIYAANCASCHSADGSGGIGPQLSDGKVVHAFPNVNDEVQFVTNGRDGMPAFGGELSPAEVADVVNYTRTL
jgi:mono/diheme cytochrome c family protein